MSSMLIIPIYWQSGKLIAAAMYFSNDWRPACHVLCTKNGLNDFSREISPNVGQL